MKLKKWKLTVASLLAVCCLGTAAAGAALTATPVAADEPLWEGIGGGKAVGEITVFEANTSIRNNVDIMQLPNHTGVFYMYYTDSLTWSGFSFRNGNDGVGYSWILEEVQGETHIPLSVTDFPWHTVAMQDKNCDMILQDNRIFTTGGTLGGIKGNSGETVLDGLVPVEVHIGEGTAKNDPSYIKIGGVELMQEDDTTKAITQPWTRASGTSKELVASMFPKGCYVVVNHNFGSAVSHELALSNVGSVVGLNASMDMTQIQQVGAFSKDLTVDLSSATEIFKDDYTVTAKVNGHELAGAVTVDKTDNTHAKATISKAKLNEIPVEQLSARSYFTIEVKSGEKSYGSAAIGVRITFEDPPTFDKTDIQLTEKQAFSYGFTYTGTLSEPEKDAKLFYRYSSSGDMLPLTKDTDFTVTKAGEKYTLTVTAAGAEKLFNGHASVTLFAKIGPGDPIRLTAFLNGQTNEYGVRFREGIDYVDGTLKQDKFYSSATMRIHNPAILSSRVFYEKPVDITKPIFIEYSYLPLGVDWMLISVMNDPAICENFTETTSPSLGNTFSMIIFGEGANGGSPGVQGMNSSLANGNTVGCSRQTKQKNNVAEIFFSATDDANEGYVKINGAEIGAKPAVKQSDFPDGTGYVGFFFNNGAHEFEFSANSNLNPVVIDSPQDDNKYKMDLGDAKDFSVDLLNTSGKLVLTDDCGDTIPATQFAFDGGRLTIKAAYFSGRTFTREGQIFIWDTEKKTGTAFRMAFTNSATEPALVEYLTKGDIKDVTFDLGISGMQYVLHNDEAVPSANYTFEGGKFTVKKAAIPDEIGFQEYLIGGADGKLYPCYIYVNAWDSNGIAKTGDGTLEGSGDSYTITGKLSFDRMKSYDLTQGLTFSVEFATIKGYFQNELNKNGVTGLVIKLYDPGKGYTLQFSLYPNFADDKITDSNDALYLRYAVLGQDGKTLSSATNKARSVAAPSASGTHNFTLQATSEGLEITYAGYEFSFKESDLGGFNTKNCVLTLDTSASAAESVVKVAISDGVHADTIGGGSSNTPGGSEEEGGCGSVIAESGIAILAALALGTALALVLRRRKD